MVSANPRGLNLPTWEWGLSHQTNLSVLAHFIAGRNLSMDQFCLVGSKGSPEEPQGLARETENRLVVPRGRRGWSTVPRSHRRVNPARRSNRAPRCWVVCAKVAGRGDLKARCYEKAHGGWMRWPRHHLRTTNHQVAHLKLKQSYESAVLR